MKLLQPLGLLLFNFILLARGQAEESSPSPYEQQVSTHVARLQAEAAHVRARAAESLGFLRAYAAQPALLSALRDSSVAVRREAALALAWCGGREAVPPLLAALDDADWVVRQAAHVALTNLTGMEFPYHADAAGRTAGGAGPGLARLVVDGARGPAAPGGAGTAGRRGRPRRHRCDRVDHVQGPARRAGGRPARAGLLADQERRSAAVVYARPGPAARDLAGHRASVRPRLLHDGVRVGDQPGRSGVRVRAA